MSSRTLHHIGYVVASIADAAPQFQKSLNVEWNGLVIHDPAQMVRVTFLPAHAPGGVTLELVEPAGPRSPVTKFLAAGGGLHHVCYEVADLASQMALSKAAGDVMVRVPMRAQAFQGRRICWFITPARLLVEYLEKSPC
jgi:methylmalonyl-CoA/ethylmalonyl-CoA epimerase